MARRVANEAIRKSLAVLVLLRQRVGQVVLREELLKEVWPGTVVSDDALARCICQLRRHLSLACGSDSYKALFETFPKRVFAIDIETCLSCGGKLRVIASIEDPSARRASLYRLDRADSRASWRRRRVRRSSAFHSSAAMPSPESGAAPRGFVVLTASPPPGTLAATGESWLVGGRTGMSGKTTKIHASER